MRIAKRSTADLYLNIKLVYINSSIYKLVFVFGYTDFLQALPCILRDTRNDIFLDR